MEKTLVFTDIHFGEKSNSVTFNKDCLDFLDWMIDIAKKENIKKCYFLGDWHHIRSSINVHTLNYSLQGIRKLSQNFEKVEMILGNHDLYYRESLSMHSLEFIKEFPNITVHDKITTVDEQFTFVPWLLEGQWKEVQKIDTPYIFGHFVIPGFLVNAMVAMPDTGELNSSSFHPNVKYVFSGHFHKRQVQLNERGYEIHYMGNCFPHNFNDVNDTSRGICILEDDKDPRYINWTEMPNYKSLKLSELLEQPEDYINEKTYAKITLDLNISYEEANFIRETFVKIFGARELSFTHEKKEIENFTELEDITFESVDTIVLKCLSGVESKTIDNRLLVSMYNSL